jgi:hypothetical protein
VVVLGWAWQSMLLGLGHASACAPVAAVNRRVFLATLFYCFIIPRRVQTTAVAEKLLWLVGTSRTVQCPAVYTLYRIVSRSTVSRALHGLGEDCRCVENHGLLRRALHSIVLVNFRAPAKAPRFRHDPCTLASAQ